MKALSFQSDLKRSQQPYQKIHYRLVGDRMHFRGREKARGRTIPKERNLENRVISELSTFLFAILFHIRCGIQTRLSRLLPFVSRVSNFKTFNVT